MTKPQRIQLRRTAGWRKPEGAIVVSRPSKWGNPWEIQDLGKYFRVRHREDHSVFASGLPTMWRARQDATTAYRYSLTQGQLPYTIEDVERELGGHDLCCWCPPTPLNPNGSVNWLGLGCHADALIEYANGDGS